MWKYSSTVPFVKRFPSSIGGIRAAGTSPQHPAAQQPPQAHNANQAFDKANPLSYNEAEKQVRKQASTPASNDKYASKQPLQSESYQHPPAEGVGEKLRHAYEQTAERVKHAAETVGEKLYGTKERVAESASQASEQWSGAKDRLGERAKRAGESMGEKLSSTKERVSESAKRAGEKVKGAPFGKGLEDPEAVKKEGHGQQAQAINRAESEGMCKQ